MENKIMIVDDALFMRRVIRKILEKMDCRNLVEAGEGEEAIRLYREQRPDLVFLDITMPGRSGIEILDDIIRQDSAARVIMCSAMGQEAMIRRALELGAVDFIVKPFQEDEFCKVVKHHLQKSKR